MKNIEKLCELFMQLFEYIKNNIWKVREIVKEIPYDIYTLIGKPFN